MLAGANPPTSARERKLAERALELFSITCNLNWDDSYDAAVFEQKHGTERLQQVLRVVVDRGYEFADTVALVDDALLPHTAPLNGRQPVMVAA